MFFLINNRLMTVAYALILNSFCDFCTPTTFSRVVWLTASTSMPTRCFSKALFTTRLYLVDVPLWSRNVDSCSKWAVAATTVDWRSVGVGIALAAIMPVTCPQPSDDSHHHLQRCRCLFDESQLQLPLSKWQSGATGFIEFIIEWHSLSDLWLWKLIFTGATCK